MQNTLSIDWSLRENNFVCAIWLTQNVLYKKKMVYSLFFANVELIPCWKFCCQLSFPSIFMNMQSSRFVYVFIYYLQKVAMPAEELLSGSSNWHMFWIEQCQPLPTHQSPPEALKFSLHVLYFRVVLLFRILWLQSWECEDQSPTFTWCNPFKVYKYDCSISSRKGN